MTAALALMLMPVSVRAEVVQPEPPLEPPPPEPPPPIEPPPEPQPAPEPQPPPQPQPVEPLAERPAPAAAAVPILGPTPAQIAKLRTMRRAGIGLIATGGVVATTGLGLTIAFTVLGHQEQDADEPVLEDIEQKDSMARVGGIVLASGLAVVAIGGLIFASAKRRAVSLGLARVRVAPAIGGLVVSGRF